MISVNQAIKIVENNSAPLGIPEIKQLSQTTNYTLFEDIISPIDMPPFRQSAMDGYAVHLHDSLSYEVIDEVKAGDHHQPALNKGEAVRIFTGASVPDTANAIVIQEKVLARDHTIKLETAANINDNIRPLGEQIKIGQVALKKGF